MTKKQQNKIDNVNIINLLPYFKFPHIVAKNVLIKVLAHFKYKPDTINIIFMNDHNIKSINSKFLAHNYSTDVISFKLNQVKAGSHKIIEAEIYIGVEEVKRNSLLYKTKFYHEIKRVIIHGTLHLVGFNDNTKIKRDKMRTWEDYFLGM